MLYKDDIFYHTDTLLDIVCSNRMLGVQGSLFIFHLLVALQARRPPPPPSHHSAPTMNRPTIKVGRKEDSTLILFSFLKIVSTCLACETKSVDWPSMRWKRQCENESKMAWYATGVRQAWSLDVGCMTSCTDVKIQRKALRARGQKRERKEWVPQAVM